MKRPENEFAESFSLPLISHSPKGSRNGCVEPHLILGFMTSQLYLLANNLSIIRYLHKVHILY